MKRLKKEICKRDIFIACIKDKVGDLISLPSDCDPKYSNFVPYKHNEEIPRSIPENNLHPIIISLTDTLINSEVLFD